MVESQPSKLLVAGSIPVSRSSLCELKQGSEQWGAILGERVRCKGGLTVESGNPSAVCKRAWLVARPDAEQPYLHRPAMAPVSDRSYLRADVAQEVERVLGKDEVTGSSPVIGSNRRPEGRTSVDAPICGALKLTQVFIRERVHTWRRKNLTDQNPT